MKETPVRSTRHTFDIGPRAMYAAAFLAVLAMFLASMAYLNQSSSRRHDLELKRQEMRLQMDAARMLMDSKAKMPDWMHEPSAEHMVAPARAERTIGL